MGPVRPRGLELVGVIALGDADPTGPRAKTTTAELIPTLLGFLTEEVEADQIAARGGLRSIRAGAFHSGIADVIGTGVDADVVALNCPLTTADAAGGRRAARGRVGVT